MIFVSYAREDHVCARKLEQEMLQSCIPFLRDVSLAEGDPFWRCKIANQMKQCEVMVILSSCYAWSSPWVEQEIRAFEGLKLFILLDDFLIPSDILDNSEARLISCENVIEDIKKYVPSTIIVSQSNPVSARTHDEAEVHAVRQKRLADEQHCLSRFLSTLEGRETIFEVCGDYAFNRIDGSRLMRIFAYHPTSETKKTLLYLGVEPVTNMQYRRFIQATGFASPPTWIYPDFTVPDAPIVGINWFEASAYAAWVGGSLPTEEEWEWAAQGSDLSRKYSTFSGCIGPDQAHYAQPFGSGAPLPNRAFPPNLNGFFGMCGNTWDWCVSLWGSHRVIRGGSYIDSASFCGIQARYRNSPIDRDCSVGFRIKLEVPFSKIRSYTMTTEPRETEEPILTEHAGNKGREKEGTQKRVEILSKVDIFQKSIFRVEETHLRHERYDGSMTHDFVRVNLDRGDSVAAILHDEKEDKVILIEQFRYPTYEKGPGWIIELPAGIIDSGKNETPEVTIQREIMEEIGYCVQNLHHVSTFYTSPGGSSERIYLYYASVTPKDCVAVGGGLIESGEDIRKLPLSVDDALVKVTSGEIVDAKTIIALQWLQHHHSR